MYEVGREGDEIGMLMEVQVMGGVGTNCVNSWGVCLLLGKLRRLLIFKRGVD